MLQQPLLDGLDRPPPPPGPSDRNCTGALIESQTTHCCCLLRRSPRAARAVYKATSKVEHQGSGAHDHHQWPTLSEQKQPADVVVWAPGGAQPVSIGAISQATSGARLQ